MFGWFSKKKSATNTEEREWTVAEFRKRCQRIEAAEESAQLAFSIITAMHWKAFLAQHGNPARFGRLSRDQQMDYFRKWIGLCQKYVVSNDEEKLISAEMLSYYLAALINNDREFEAEASTFLDKYARKGWDFA